MTTRPHPETFATATDWQRPRLVIVGLRFGKTLLDQILNSSFLRIAGVCDLNRELAESIARQYQVPVFADVEAVAASSEVDCVGLFTGPAGRARLAGTLIRAGKAVLTTKPFETRPDDAEELLRLAQSGGIPVHCNSPSLHPAEEILAIRSALGSSLLGRPVQVKASCWASYQEVADGTWYDSPADCPAAPLLRLGIYLFNDLAEVFGDWTHFQVFSSRLRTGRPTADNAIALAAFPSGVLATIHVSFCLDGYLAYQNALEIFCERGVIRRQREPGGEHSSVEVLKACEGGLRTVSRDVFSRPSGTYDLEAFSKAVRLRLPNPPDYDHRLLRSASIFQELRSHETPVTDG
jgi:predicted dehydrogenase